MDFVAVTNSRERRLKDDKIYGNIKDVVAAARKEEQEQKGLVECLCSCGTLFLSTRTKAKFCAICKRKRVKELAKQTKERKKQKELETRIQVERLNNIQSD